MGRLDVVKQVVKDIIRKMYSNTQNLMVSPSHNRDADYCQCLVSALERVDPNEGRHDLISEMMIHSPSMRDC
jgi:hypothetical protein